MNKLIQKDTSKDNKYEVLKIEVLDKNIDDIENARIKINYSIKFENNTLSAYGLGTYTGTTQQSTEIWFTKKEDNWAVSKVGYMY